MIKKQKDYVLGLELLCWFCVYYSIICTALVLTGSPVAACLWSIILLIPFAGTVILSMRAKNAFLYVLYHIFLLVCLWFILHFTGNISGATPWIFTVGIVAAFVIFFSKRTHISESKHYLKVIPAVVFVFFVLGIIANNFDAAYLSPLYLICACIYLLGYILSKYINNLNDYISGNRQVANMPVTSIKKASHGLMAAFMILCLAAIVIFTNMGLGRIVSGLGTLGKHFLRWFFSLFPESESSVQTITETVEESMAAMENPMMSLEDDGTSEVMVALSDVLISVFRIALIIIVAVGIIYGIYQLFQRFGHATFDKKAKKQEDEETYDDVVEKIVTQKNKRRSLFSERLPEDKIRRVYYKKVQAAHKKDAVDKTMTPKELTAKISQKDSEYQNEFTQIYEQARYGPEADQNLDVSYYKNLAKKI